MDPRSGVRWVKRTHGGQVFRVFAGADLGVFQEDQISDRKMPRFCRHARGYHDHLAQANDDGEKPDGLVGRNDLARDRQLHVKVAQIFAVGRWVRKDRLQT